MLNTLTIDNKVLSYNDTLKFAKKIDPENFMDITHDYLLDGGNLKSLKFNYRSSAVNDFTKLHDTSNTCTICNEIKPVACFKIVDSLGSKYVGNQCKDCLHERYKERYKNDPEFRAAVYYHNKKWRVKNPLKYQQYQKEYWKVWSKNNAEYLKVRNEVYRLSNKELLREKDQIRKSKVDYKLKQKQWREENREYRLEYMREWRNKNKEKGKKPKKRTEYHSDYYTKNAEHLREKRRERYHLNKLKDHETTY